LTVRDLAGCVPRGIGITAEERRDLEQYFLSVASLAGTL